MLWICVTHPQYLGTEPERYEGNEAISGPEAAIS